MNGPLFRQSGTDARNWASTPESETFRHMSSASSDTATSFVQGDVAFVQTSEISAHLTHAARSGLLTVEVASPGPAARGRLARVIEAAIEDALLARGACAPGVGASASLDASLSDQLYRARLLELRGMALGLRGLLGLSDLRGALDPDDGAALRFYVRAATEAPIQLFFDRENLKLGVYGAPEPLMDVVNAETVGHPRRDTIPIVAPEVAASSAAMGLSEPPPAVVERDGALAFEQELEAVTTPAPEVEVAPAVRAAARVDDGTPLPIGDLADALMRSLAAESAPEPQLDELAAPALALAPALADAPAPAVAAVEAPEAPAADAPEPAAAPLLAVPPLYPHMEREWRGWLADLKAARGPRPLSVIERMFVTSYVPLRNAVLAGVADDDAESTLDTWSASFASSYREAFDALRVRGKRPTMVLDVPELALRIGRLHGARTTGLVLVDGLRFDLGLRVEQRVRALVGQQAALTERLLLWSALPSTTEVQLDLIGRGADALRDSASEPRTEIPVARGRSASTLRRIKASHRELWKLDLVEARLAEPGAAEGERLDALADETASVLAEHLLRQQPRTLVLAFGDHGFLLDRLEDGTQAARSGGSTPEEVLVPAFAWLVGGMH